MVNTIVKMRKSQQAAAKWLKGQGWNAWTIHHTRWSKDIFSLFDGIAYRGDEIALFQVKSNSWPDMTSYEEFSRKCKVVIIRVNDARKCKGRRPLVEGRWLNV